MNLPNYWGGEFSTAPEPEEANKETVAPVTPAPIENRSPEAEAVAPPKQVEFSPEEGIGVEKGSIVYNQALRELALDIRAYQSENTDIPAGVNFFGTTFDVSAARIEAVTTMMGQELPGDLEGKIFQAIIAIDGASRVIAIGDRSLLNFKIRTKAKAEKAN